MNRWWQGCPRQRILAVIAAVAAFGLAADAAERRGTDLVTVHSAAHPEYLARKFADGGPLPETYVFTPGRYFGGAARDRTMEDTTFQAIVETLAEDLVRQNYYPIKDANAADLILVVHWGTTLIREDFDALEQMEETLNTGEMTADEINFYQLMRETEALSIEHSTAYNARLLGYVDALEKERRRLTVSGVSQREHNLRRQLNQERYFAIVMAYDYAAIREHNEKKLLWSTRFSMRTPGKNFAEALPAMSRVAGDYFGTELPDLATKRTHLGEGRVDLSDIEVIEMESPPEPPMPPPPRQRN